MYIIPRTIEEAEALTRDDLYEMSIETDPDKIAQIQASRELLEPLIMEQYWQEEPIYWEDNYMDY